MPEFLARKFFRELEDLERLIESFGARARVRKMADVVYRDKAYPLYCVVIGSQKPEDAAIGFFGGVHGLEKIGSEVVLSHMHTVQELLNWDEQFQHRLQTSRLVFMPIVNPVGIVHRTRSNGNGVDLMRNSPMEGDDIGGPIFRGHRISPWLPWYRGPLGAEMEVEAKALCDVVRSELLPAKLSMAVDVHSGFGARDRFWFPYAYTHQPFPFLAEAFSLKQLFDQTYPHHFYAFEPVSRQYTINGDLWDYLFDDNRKSSTHFFLPFTLEIGSWLWLKKNPLQIFSRFGPFHPIQPHRHSRILRRHLNLFDFLHRSILSPKAWVIQSEEQRSLNHRRGLGLWYG